MRMINSTPESGDCFKMMVIAPSKVGVYIYIENIN